MKKFDKKDIIGQSSSTLDEAIERAVSQGKSMINQYKVIEIIGQQRTNQKNQYQVVLSER
jgi:flavin-binding protein dodecin